MATTNISFAGDEQTTFDSQPDAQTEIDALVTSKLDEWKNQQRKRLAEQFVEAMDSKDSAVMAATAVLKAHAEAEAEKAVEAEAVPLADPQIRRE